MRVLVACEFSGVVRTQFKHLGHDAWSCDIDDSPLPGQHIKDDVLNHLNENWDLMIAHPPCTHLAVSGARWFKQKQGEQFKALAFVQQLLDAPIPKIALENPVSIISTIIRKPDQIIHPWQFGEAENKKTCLWLKNLPLLKPTKIIPYHERRSTIHHLPPGPFRDKERSRTFHGIASAMAHQWGA